MDEIAERHLELVTEQTLADLREKYKRGHAEHGGNLLSMDALTLIDEAIGEATDQIIYLRTVRERVVTLLAQLEETTKRKGWRDQQVLDLMADNTRLRQALELRNVPL